MPFKPGESGNPAGKPKGTKHKFTSLKHMFLNVSERLGGENALLEFAKDNPKEFWRMLHVMLPRAVVEDIRENIRITWGSPESPPVSPGEIDDGENK